MIVTSLTTTLQSVAGHVTYGVSKSFDVQFVTSCSSARQPCRHTSWYTATSGRLPASTASNGFIRSPTWRSTRMFTQVISLFGLYDAYHCRFCYYPYVCHRRGIWRKRQLSHQVCARRFSRLSFPSVYSLNPPLMIGDLYDIDQFLLLLTNIIVTWCCLFRSTSTMDSGSQDAARWYPGHVLGYPTQLPPSPILAAGAERGHNRVEPFRNKRFQQNDDLLIL